MRGRILIFGALALCGALLLASLQIFSKRHAAESPRALPPPGIDESRHEVLATGSIPRERMVSTPATVSPASTAATNHEQFVEDRVAELLNLSMNDDAASLQVIVSELTNPDRQIRKGALEAAVQFGDRSVTAKLRELADGTADAEEKAELIAAADYINLPSMTEFLAEQRNAKSLSPETGKPVGSTNRPPKGFLTRPRTPGAPPQPAPNP